MSTVPFSRHRATPLPPDIAKKLPSNLDAERSVLGAILLDNHALVDAVKTDINVSYFSLSQHQTIYAAMAEMTLKQQPIDLVTLTEKLHGDGKLESAGGAPYLASLADGMPRVSNVGHYVKIIKEKWLLREVIRKTYSTMEKAYDESCTAEEVLSGASASLAELQKPSNENPVVVVPYSELLTLELPKADPLIDPLITVGGTFMIYSYAKFGKSWLATEMAFCVAKGVQTIFGGHEGPGGHWPIFGPMRTLYLYGEMHGERIRERLKLIALAHDTSPEFDGMAVVSKDYQRITRACRAAHAWRPSIATERDRKAIEEVLVAGEYKFLVLDNISTLWSAAQEDQSHQVAVLKDWFIDLNARGITILFLQHAGKSGDFLGDSAQVHILDSWIKLVHPGDYRKSQGMRCIVNVEGVRHELRDPHWAVPFEVQLVTSPERGAEWLTKPAAEALKKSAFEMFGNGAPPMIVLQQMPTLSRATVYRWWKEHKDNRSSDLRDGDEE